MRKFKCVKDMVYDCKEEIVGFIEGKKYSKDECSEAIFDEDGSLNYCLDNLSFMNEYFVEIFDNRDDNIEDGCDMEDIKVICLETYDKNDFIVGNEYLLTERGVKDSSEDPYFWDGFLLENGNNLLEKWNTYQGNSNKSGDFVALFKRAENYNLTVTPESHLVKTDNFEGDVWHADNSFSINYQGEYILDMLGIKEAKELIVLLQKMVEINGEH